MNELTVFNYGDCPVRTIQKDNEVWWVLVDVCRILEIKNPTQTAQRLDDDERAMLDIGLKNAPMVWTINEPGLYSVILRSDKPEAKAFKRWVTHEVLPEIRKNGSYCKQYDKMEIAKMIVSCKSVGAVKAIMTLFDISPAPCRIPQNANNSVSMFLREFNEITSLLQKQVYEKYKWFCQNNQLVPSTLANFSKEIHKQTGLIVKRKRIDGKLESYYCY